VNAQALTILLDGRRRRRLSRRDRDAERQDGRQRASRDASRARRARSDARHRARRCDDARIFHRGGASVGRGARRLGGPQNATRRATEDDVGNVDARFGGARGRVGTARATRRGANDAGARGTPGRGTPFIGTRGADARVRGR